MVPIVYSGGEKMTIDGATMLNAWSSHDVDKVLSLYSDDCTYEDLALGRVNRGKAELKAFVMSTYHWSPDVKFEVKSAFNSGEWAASEWVMAGTHTGTSPQMPATGKKFSIHGASIVQAHKGKISRQSDYWNLAAFLLQVGLMPSTAG
jgi:steroid delta-isomerase-like uncharacterized protein